MNCRIGCGACCIAPSISSALPGMPHGKPANVRCINLNEQNECRVWGTELYPEVCRDFPAKKDVCAESREEALTLLSHWETWTAPPAFSHAENRSKS